MSRLTRRHFLASTTSAFAVLNTRPLWAQSPQSHSQAGLSALSGQDFDLAIDRTDLMINGRTARPYTANGTLPAPLLRWREGDEVTLRVHNHLREQSSIHWHGILLPFEMDGVPGVTFPGINGGETFTYRFTLKQTGTYWYHSHSGMQEQAGLYGPLIIEPRTQDPYDADRDYVLVLSDWTFMNPDRLFRKLKANAESFNYQKRTVGDFWRDARSDGLDATLKDRGDWGRMRMMPTDIADVTGETYTYLINGHAPGENWTALFKPGERVRLRIINAAAMSLFNVRIPGLAMTVIEQDGLPVSPVETDEFQIGVAETFDVLVEPREDKAFTIMAEAMDRSGFGRATLAPRPGMQAPVPPLRPAPLLTMKDMGHGEMSGASMDHAAMGHSQSHDHQQGSGVDMVAMMPTNRLGEPGLGLQDQPHRVLVYSDLRSAAPNPDTRAPSRVIELHLTSNMHRYMWSFDGIKFSDATDPIILYRDERVRFTLVNDTMMAHPVHLHGMFFELVTHEGPDKPRKHTVVVKPGETLSFDVTADAVGDWAFHCHLLYHMAAGMMRVVRVLDEPAPDTRPATQPPAMHHHDHHHHGSGGAS